MSSKNARHELVERIETAYVVSNALETVAVALIQRFPDYSGEQIQDLIATIMPQYVTQVSDFVEAYSAYLDDSV
jgi:hypothetical protein